MNKALSLFLWRRPTMKAFQRGIMQVEPPYLDHRESDIPVYPLLNIQLKGYDFTVLERFGKWIHNTASHMDIEVEECWPTPFQKLEVITYLPNSSQIDSTYNLQVYERNVQVSELPSTVAPLFFEVIKKALPIGVEVSIHEHMEEYENIRKIPDLHLRELKQQLEELGGPSSS